MALITNDDQQTLLRHLTEPDEDAALGQVRGCLDAGIPPERLLVELVAPALARVGDRWQRDQLSVADEHVASYISERLLAAIVERNHPTPTGRGDLIVACAEGEWHALPARIVSDVLRLRGWQVRFLGACVPVSDIGPYLADVRPAGALFSATMSSRLPEVRRAVQVCHHAGVPTLVGGAALGAAGRLTYRIGADAWAPDALAAADLLEEWPPPLARKHIEPSANDEHARLSRDRWRLVDQVIKILIQRYPALRRFSPERLENAIDELDRIVDFLTSAVCLDDDHVFTEYVQWLVEVCVTHREPVALVELALQALTEQLGDRPRTQRVLTAGVTAAHTTRHRTDGPYTSQLVGSNGQRDR
ncbi:cobalamin B12-binding domain-containing protein [Pilimelia columellifera]|uniref:Cobalamin-dependent protein n=1 Tax=Pilimelia columellifera subsp. columellifera TaxID=706583 RepID=A0ABN3MX48_9ACTN